MNVKSDESCIANPKSGISDFRLETGLRPISKFHSCPSPEEAENSTLLFVVRAGARGGSLCGWACNQIRPSFKIAHEIGPRDVVLGLAGGDRPHRLLVLVRHCPENLSPYDFLNLGIRNGTPFLESVQDHPYPFVRYLLLSQVFENLAHIAESGYLGNGHDVQIIGMPE